MLPEQDNEWMLVALLVNKCHFWDEKAKISTWNWVGCATKAAGTAWPCWAGGRTVSISPGTVGSVVVAEDTPKKGVTWEPMVKPSWLLLHPSCLREQGNVLPKKTGLDTGNWLWAVNPGNPALLCCFSLSTKPDIQVIYGSFLHKAGTRGWGAPLEGSWAECKAAGGADLFRADVHNALSQNYWSSSFCSHIMWSPWHFYFVLSLPGKLSSKSLSCCQQLPWVTVGRTLESEQHMIPTLGRCEGPKSVPVATTAVLQLLPPAPSTAVCSTPKGICQVGQSEAWFELTATSWTGWEGALLQKFLLKKLAIPFTTCAISSHASISSRQLPLPAQCCWAQPATPQNQSCKVS